MLSLEYLMIYPLEHNARSAGAMADRMILELAEARQRVKRTELALKRAKEMLDEDCGVGIKIALCSRISFAQRCVTEAKEHITKIEPTGSDGVRSG